MKNYSYLSPSSGAHKIAQTESHIFDKSVSNMRKTAKRRKIFDIPPQRYEQHEVQALNKIKEYFKHKDPTKTYPDSLLLKYCYLGKFMTAQSVQKFHFFQDWNSLPDCSKQKEKGILHSGVFYCFGKDQSFSPTIYFHPVRLNLEKFHINDYLVCLRTLLKPIEEHMLVPGKVQHWNVIVDFRACEQKKIKTFYDLALKAFEKIIYAYPYRLKKLLVIENHKWKKWQKWESKQSQTKTFIENFFKDLNISGFQKQTVIIQNLKMLNQYISVEEREEEYGGRLQNLCEFWPITTTNKLLEMNSGYQDISMDSDDYLSIRNDENKSFFNEDTETSTICDFKSCQIF